MSLLSFTSQTCMIKNTFLADIIVDIIVIQTIAYCSCINSFFFDCFLFSLSNSFIKDFSDFILFISLIITGRGRVFF